MRLTVQVILVICGLTLASCALFRSGLIRPELTIAKPGQDANLVKTGDIAPIKAPVQAEADCAAQGSAGAYNTNSKTSTSAGGDITNDSAVMKEYIGTIKELNGRQITFMARVILGLGGALLAIAGLFAGFITTLIAGLLWVIKFSMRSGAEEDKFKERLIAGDKTGRNV